MIANNVVQAAIIARLNANAALVAWLAARSAGDEIRESQWQGSAFSYPAVRVELGAQVPDGDTSICYLRNGEVPFTVFSFSEKDSSQEADILANLVNTALLGGQLSGTNFRSLAIRSDGLVHAARTAERAWRATGLYRAYIYGT